LHDAYKTRERSTGTIGRIMSGIDTHAWHGPLQHLLELLVASPKLSGIANLDHDTAMQWGAWDTLNGLFNVVGTVSRVRFVQR